MCIEKIYIQSNSHSLCSILNKKTSNTTAVLIHGFAGNKDENGFFRSISDYLAKMNINSLRFDLFGCGESSGDFKKASLSKLNDDLYNVIRFLGNRYPLISENIILIGFSLGATIVIDVFTKILNKNERNQIKALILISPAFFPNIDMYPRYNNNLIKTELNKNGYFKKGEVLVGKTLINKSIRQANTLNRLHKIDRPVLIIHGTEDARIKIKSSILATDYIKHNKMYKIVGAGHSYKSEKDTNKVLNKIGKWIEVNKFLN